MLVVKIFKLFRMLWQKNLRKADHIAFLRWLPIHVRLDFEVLLITDTIINGLAPHTIFTLQSKAALEEEVVESLSVQNACL